MTATIYGPSASGARIVSFDVAGMRVIVDPLDSDNNTSAVELAERIERYEQEVAALRNALARIRDEAQKIIDAKLLDAWGTR